MDRIARQAAERLISGRRHYRATRANRCPVCEHDSWCLVSDFAVLCPRADGSGAAGKCGEYGYLYLLDGSSLDAAPRPPPERRTTDTEQDARWRGQAERWRRTDRLPELAAELGVSVEALAVLWIGWSSEWRAWTVPEWSPERRILGVSLRYPGGRKMFVAGGRRGLVYPIGWGESCEGRVIIVEGASDTAAALDAGWTAIGRPSNTGGLRHLVRLLGREAKRGSPQKRRLRVLVAGENDRKPHDGLPEIIRSRHDPTCNGCRTCWPGKYGAERVAEGLRQGTACHVTVALPSRGKDVRELLKKAEARKSPDSA